MAPERQARAFFLCLCLCVDRSADRFCDTALHKARNERAKRSSQFRLLLLHACACAALDCDSNPHHRVCSIAHSHIQHINKSEREAQP